MLREIWRTGNNYIWHFYGGFNFQIIEYRCKIWDSPKLFGLKFSIYSDRIYRQILKHITIDIKYKLDICNFINEFFHVNNSRKIKWEKVFQSCSHNDSIVTKLSHCWQLIKELIWWWNTRLLRLPSHSPSCAFAKCQTRKFDWAPSYEEKN